MKTQITTILFDLDDTLMVEKQSARETFLETINGLDSRIDRDAFVEAIHEEARKIWYGLPVIGYARKVGLSSWEALWGDFDGRGRDLEALRKIARSYREGTWTNTLARFGVDDPQLAVKLASDFKRIRNTRHHLFPDAGPCLDRTGRTFAMGLITNGVPDIQWKKIRGGHLHKVFTHIAISGEHGYAKPDPRLFGDLLAEMGCKADQAVMVGNNIRTDIAGARKMGLTTVWLNREGAANGESDIQPDHEIGSLDELDGVLSALS